MGRAKDGLGGGVQDRATPQWLVDLCAKRFGVEIVIDLAANQTNAKHFLFLSEADDSLSKDWSDLPDIGEANTSAWLNPPFDKVTPWMEKCALQTKADPELKIITLTLAALGTRWYQSFVKPNAMSFILLERIQFQGCDAPFNKECMISLWGFGMNGLSFWKQGKGNEK